MRVILKVLNMKDLSTDMNSVETCFITVSTHWVKHFFLFWGMIFLRWEKYAFTAAFRSYQLDFKKSAGPVGPDPLGAGNARDFFSVRGLNFLDMLT